MTSIDLELAIHEHQQGNLQRAESLYLAFLSIQPNNPIAGYNLGMLFLSRGELKGLNWIFPALSNNTNELDIKAASNSVVQTLLIHQYKEAAHNFLVWLEDNHLIQEDFDQLKKSTGLPSYLQPLSPARLNNNNQVRQLRRYHPIENSRYVYAIDIVGGCNLRCPSCPVGQGASLSKGLMRRELFQAILRKVSKDQAPHKPDIWLFNWGEPLLHPKIADFVRDVHEAGLTSFISTNLNQGERIDAVMQENPQRLKISLSSLRQEAYVQTHVRGDIERVKKNLHRLARARDRYKATTQIWIGHHLYRHTVQDQSSVKALAESLGFGYAASVGIVAPIEKALSWISNRYESQDDQMLQSLLLTDPAQISKTMSAHRSGDFDCELRFNMTSIQYDGQVTLCCGTTKPLGNSRINFLEYDHSLLEAKKYENPFCDICIQNNLHLTVSDL